MGVESGNKDLMVRDLVTSNSYNMCIKTLKEARRKTKNREVRRERLNDTICGLVNAKKRVRPTLLTRDEEALMVAKK